MNNTNVAIIKAFDELRALHDSLMRRVMSDEIEKEIPRIVAALQATHKWLRENVPEKLPED
jgi:hypothetical protein